jgi:hypothetical protein
MKYTVAMDSGAMTYILSFIKIGSGIQKFIGRDSQPHRRQDDLISPLPFFLNNESSLKISNVVFQHPVALYRFDFGVSAPSK